MSARTAVTPSDPKHRAPPTREPAWRAVHAPPRGSWHPITLPSVLRGLRLNPSPPSAKGAGREALTSLPPPPPPPRRAGRLCLLAEQAAMSGCPSTRHGSLQMLRGDNGSGDDLQGARENNFARRGFLDINEPHKNPRYPQEATEMRTHNVLFAIPPAKTRLLNARAEIFNSQSETAGLGGRCWGKPATAGTGDQSQSCGKAGQSRAPGVSRNSSGNRAGHFTACKIPSTEAAKQPPATVAVPALQPRLRRRSAPLPLPEPPAEELYRAPSCQPRLDAAINCDVIRHSVISIILQNNMKRE